LEIMATRLELAAQIVATYARNHAVAASELPQIIRQVYEALDGATEAQVSSSQTSTPAVRVNKSVFPDHMVCLEDGKSFKALKRHLRTSHGLTPDEYRAKWGLPHNYPMTASSYAAKRSMIAKTLGLGRLSYASRKRNVVP
jgi:predicted transcriptional regulator